MPDQASVSVPAGLDLQGILLDSKIRVPAWRTDAVSRRPLIDRARASNARVVVVAAPAGYGKSTLLAEWAEAESRNIAWVTWERTDDDPAMMLPVIAAASAAVSPVAASIVADMRGIGPASLGRSAPLLASALSAAPASFVLFMDDVHTVDSPECQDALEVLLAGVPAGSQVVLAARREPALTARLRATGDAWAVTADDLRLDADGARSIFEHAGVAQVTDDDLGGIVDRCEGWPTGLFLSALVARSGGDAASVTGDDRYLADYLYRECLARLEPDMQRFLRRSAVLDQFSPAACNAVLGIEDARARLHEIEAANLFLVPMDRTRGWFRYHALFREFLLIELERAEGASAVAELHVRAADWHEDHGAPALALEHLLRAGETERAVQLVAALALPTYQAGQVATVRRWLGELGEEAVRNYPPLVVLMTWATALLGEVVNGTHWAAVLDGIESFGETDAERDLFESARGMVRAAICPDGVERMTADARFALEHEPATSPWRPQAYYMWASACLLRGERAAAREALEQVILSGGPVDNVDTTVLSEADLAILAIDDSLWHEAAVHARRAVEVIDDNHIDGYRTTALALAVAARVAFYEGDRDRGLQLLARGMRARIGCTWLLPYLSLRVRLQLAKAHLAVGDRSGARHLVREMDDLLRRRPDVGVVRTEVEEFRAVMAGAPGGGSVPLTPAELRVLPYLQTHLTIAEIGERLFISRNTVSSEIGSIYRKLGVATRAAAVERAGSLGLLGG